MTNTKRVAMTLLVASALVVGILMGPVASWLRAPDADLTERECPDAFYLVAGASHQERRVAAIVARLYDLDAKARPLGFRVLIGNDHLPGDWSPEHRRNLSMTEWAEEKLTAGVRGTVALEVVPGLFWGTDGEMAALAAFLAQRSELRHITLVSSPFHLRRSLRRVRAHLSVPVRVTVLGAAPWLSDRSPRTVAAELAKMARDRFGLARAPFLCRRPLSGDIAWEGGVGHNGAGGAGPAWGPALQTALLLVLALLGYAWLGYPVLVAMWARLLGRRSREDTARCRLARQAGATDEHAPRVAVLLAAHNEEQHMAARLTNLLAEARCLAEAGTELGGGAFEIHVGVDGSTDGTARIARTLAEGHDNIHVRVFEQRRGKVAVLKDLVGPCRADIIVMTDANAFFRAGALPALTARLSDPRVGAVCGRLILHAGSAAGAIDHAVAGPSTAEGVYWGWETRIKGWESAVDSCLGANGAIYAIRRALFWSRIPDNTIVDDFVLGMKVREQGRCVVYEPEAVAEEELPEVAHEWHRRVRIGAGDYQALRLCWRCLLPKYGRFAWMFLSHKVLRWFTPHLLLIAIALTVADLSTMEWRLGGSVLVQHATGVLSAIGISAFLVCALLGRVVRGTGQRGIGRWLRRGAHFVAMQAALFTGFLRFCRGGLQGHWNRTPRRTDRNDE